MTSRLFELQGKMPWCDKSVSEGDPLLLHVDAAVAVVIVDMQDDDGSLCCRRKLFWVGAGLQDTNDVVLVT
jgi:hypothetical protein